MPVEQLGAKLATSKPSTIYAQAKSAFFSLHSTCKDPLVIGTTFTPADNFRTDVYRRARAAVCRL
jgi:hypothetical protein